MIFAAAALALLLVSEGGPSPDHRPMSPVPERVSFHNGSVTLVGSLYLPGTTGRHPGVVAFHASNGGTRDYPAYRHLATALPAAGFAVLLFDRRGSGESGGDFETATFQDLAADGLAGVLYLKSRADIDPVRIGVWGVSQGGWLGPLAATMSRDVAFVVSVSGPGVTPAEQMNYSAAYALRSAGESPAVIQRALRVRAAVDDYFRGRATRRVTEQAVESIRHQPWFEQVFLPIGDSLPGDPKHTKWYSQMDYDPLQVLARVKVPIAFFFAETDPWVPVEESMTLVRRATRNNPNVTIRRVPRTGHYMEVGADGPVSNDYLTRLLQWLRRTAGMSR
jgi:hypothetical protein